MTCRTDSSLRVKAKPWKDQLDLSLASQEQTPSPLLKLPHQTHQEMKHGISSKVIALLSNIYKYIYKTWDILGILGLCLWWSSPNSSSLLQWDLVSGLVLQVSSSVVVTALPHCFSCFFHCVNFSVYCSSFIHVGNGVFYSPYTTGEIQKKCQLASALRFAAIKTIQEQKELMNIEYQKWTQF